MSLCVRIHFRFCTVIVVPQYDVCMSGLTSLYSLRSLVVSIQDGESPGFSFCARESEGRLTDLSQASPGTEA